MEVFNQETRLAEFEALTYKLAFGELANPNGGPQSSKIDREAEMYRLLRKEAQIVLRDQGYKLPMESCGERSGE